MAKQKLSTLKSITLYILSLLFTAWLIYIFSHYLHQPRFVRYPAFGISLPINYQIHGIDVSHHQNDIDWTEVKNMQDKNVKIGFAFIKATEGISNIDNNFRRNWYNAKEAKIPRGAYHFFIANKSGILQANNFISSVVLQKNDMPPVLDIEQTNGASILEIQANAKEWLNAIEAAYNIKPIIYSNVDFYNNYLLNKFDDYPLWIAHYLVKDKPRIKRNWIFWQHNDAGQVNGIDAADVDFNVFNGDSSDFKKILIK